MLKEITINNRIIRIYYKDSLKDKLPVIILNNYEDDKNKIYNECIKLNCNEFILVTIHNIDWNNEMTPYYIDNIFKKEDKYLGNANVYLNELEKLIIPKINEYINNILNKQIEYYSLVGYSLAGLFAIFSLFNSNIFTSVASVSGSLWYPNFIEYINNNNISNNIKRVYFSLGNKENKTNNKYMKNVLLDTLEVKNIIDKYKIETIFEENEGNHFNNPDARIAKSIKWLLKK